MRQTKYMTLNGKYLKEAEAVLAANDSVQAAEKPWGAVPEEDGDGDAEPD